jgi:hypothetical protein
MGLCTSTVLDEILLLETAQEPWKTLKRNHEPTGKLQLSAKIIAFTGYEPPSGGTILEVATRLNTLQADIAYIDPQEKPSDTLKTAIFFRAVRALNPEFKPKLLQLELSGVKQWDAVVEHVAEFERHLSPRAPVETALKADASGGKRPTQGRGFKGECYNCGKKGHMARQYKSPKKPVAIGAEGVSASTGPLPHPGVSRGLSPTHQAKAANEVCWTANERPVAKGVGSLTWMVDSGCSRHMTFYKEAFQDYYKLQEPVVIITATGALLQGVGEGTVALQPVVQGQARAVELTRVLHVPGLTGSLISVLQLQDRGITVTTEPLPRTGLELRLKQKVIGVADRVGRAYMLTTMVPEKAFQAQGQGISPELMHRRFGHLSYSSLQGIEAVTTGLEGSVQKLEDHCSGCTLAKAVAVIGRKQPERTSVVLGRVWLDWWGPFKEQSLEGHTNMLTMTDEATRKVWVVFGVRRDLFRLFIELKALVELETGRKIALLRCDNALEFKLLEGSTRHTGLRFEYTTPYSA